MRDWLYEVIYGASTGRTRPKDLQLNRLAGEVRAGFEELLLPLLRQRYGIQLEVTARSIVETRSDVRLVVRPALTLGLSGGPAAALARARRVSGNSHRRLLATTSD